MREIGQGARVFEAKAVRGKWLAIETPEDVLDLMTDGAEGVIALVRDAGATFLSPIFHELAGVVCTTGTLRSHIGIVSREFQLPCVMGTAFNGSDPADGATVEVDCSGPEGIVRG